MARLLPSRPPPVPALERAGNRGHLRDRAVATWIDVAVCYLTFVVPITFVPALLSAPPRAALNYPLLVLSVLLLVPIHMTYAFAFEWQYSRTPGKVARGLTVATVDGQPLSVWDSAVRNLFRYVDLLPGPYLVGLASALLSERGQRVGDRAAGTVVAPVETRDREDESHS